jgi:hypothetical protein
MGTQTAIQQYVVPDYDKKAFLITDPLLCDVRHGMRN